MEVVRLMVVVGIVVQVVGEMWLMCLVGGGWSVTFVVFAWCASCTLFVFETVIWCGEGSLMFRLFVLFHEASLDDDLSCADKATQHCENVQLRHAIPRSSLHDCG